jgi:hypothetical protein
MSWLVLIAFALIIAAAYQWGRSLEPSRCPFPGCLADVSPADREDHRRVHIKAGDGIPLGRALDRRWFG